MYTLIINGNQVGSVNVKKKSIPIAFPKRVRCSVDSVSPAW